MVWFIYLFNGIATLYGLFYAEKYKDTMENFEKINNSKLLWWKM